MSPRTKILCRVIVKILWGVEQVTDAKEFYKAMTLLNEKIVGWLIWKTWGKELE